MRVVVDRKGDMTFRGLPALCADALLSIPELLRSEDPAVRARLEQDAYEDPEDRAQWQRYARPELARLFADRVELVERDLDSLRGDGALDYRMVVPGGHRAAWLSALNAARLSLFVGAGLEPTDMDAEPGELEDVDRDVALWRVHMLAFVQELMLEAGGFHDADD